MKTSVCAVSVVCLLIASACRHPAPMWVVQDTVTEQAAPPRIVSATVLDSTAVAHGAAGLAVRLSYPLLAGNGAPTRIRLVPGKGRALALVDSLGTASVVTFVDLVPGPYRVTAQRLGYRPQSVAATLRVGYVDTLELTLASVFP